MIDADAFSQYVRPRYWMHLLDFVQPRLRDRSLHDRSLREDAETQGWRGVGLTLNTLYIILDSA
jgi:hypothetical protein